MLIVYECYEFSILRSFGKMCIPRSVWSLCKVDGQATTLPQHCGFLRVENNGTGDSFRRFLGCWWCTKWHQIALSVEYPTICFLLCHLVKDFVHEHLEGSKEGSCCKMTLNENREVRSQKFHFDWKPSRWRFCRESFSASSHSIWQGLVSEKNDFWKNGFRKLSPCAFRHVQLLSLGNHV